MTIKLFATPLATRRPGYVGAHPRSTLDEFKRNVVAALSVLAVVTAGAAIFMLLVVR